MNLSVSNVEYYKQGTFWSLLLSGDVYKSGKKYTSYSRVNCDNSASQKRIYYGQSDTLHINDLTKQGDSYNASFSKLPQRDFTHISMGDITIGGSSDIKPFGNMAPIIFDGSKSITRSFSPEYLSTEWKTQSGQFIFPRKGLSGMKLTLFNIEYSFNKGYPVVSGNYLWEYPASWVGYTTKGEPIEWVFTSASGSSGEFSQTFNTKVSGSASLPADWKDIAKLQVFTELASHLEQEQESHFISCRDKLDADYTDAIKGGAHMSSLDLNWLETGRDVLDLIRGRASSAAQRNIRKKALAEGTSHTIDYLAKVGNRVRSTEKFKILMETRDAKSLLQTVNQTLSRKFVKDADGEIHHLTSSELKLLEDTRIKLVSELKNGKQRFGEELLKDGSALWLMYRYVYNTNKMDYEDISEEALSTAIGASLFANSFEETIHAHRPFEDGWSHNFVGYVSYGTQPSFNKEYEKLVRYGMFPTLKNLWDLVPFSFIVDWFTDLGGALGALDDQLLYHNSRVNWLGGYSTVQGTEQIEFVLLGVPVTTTLTYYDRQYMEFSPSFGGWHPALSTNPSTWLKRAADGLSLVIGAKLV